MKLLDDLGIMQDISFVQSVEGLAKESECTACHTQIARKLSVSTRECVIMEDAIPAMQSA